MAALPVRPKKEPYKELILFFRKSTLKLASLTLWLLLIGACFYFSWANGWTHETLLTALVNLVDSPYGPLIYMVIFALHPLVFSSAAILGIAGGALFGAGSTTNLVWAVVYAVIGSQSAAHVAYGIGRFLGDGLLPEGKQASVIHRYAGRLRRHSFETIFVMRLLFLPFDLVDYAAGILRINWKAFALATLLGALPGTVAFVSFGASIDLKQLAVGAAPTFDPRVFGFSVALFVVSLIVSRFVKKREKLRAVPAAQP
ncbi:MAG: TVP38/TMEM64 family protein [Caldilinea sp. CFX5]|nr:TVP38/TMEM64 family protein [Caldilinea sp. CFX5]